MWKKINVDQWNWIELRVEKKVKTNKQTKLHHTLICVSYHYRFSMICIASSKQNDKIKTHNAHTHTRNNTKLI